MTTREEVGRRIKHARESIGMSQGELGQTMARKRTHAAVSDMERGVVKLDVEELADVAEILNKDIHYFLQPSAQITWRRGDYGQTTDQKQKTNKAIAEFQAYAQSLAAKKTEN